MNIFEALRLSHERQRVLCDKIVLTKGDTQKRQELYTQLKAELQAHAQAEDRYFYAPLMFNDTGLDITRHAFSEQHEMDEYLEKLDGMTFSNSQWLVVMKQLADTIFHHLEQKERTFFVQANKILKPVQKEELAMQYLKEYDKVKRKILD